MRRWLFLTLVLFSACSSQKHVAVIQKDKTGVFYAGIDNYLRIAQHGVKCQDLLVSSQYPVKKGDDCSFTIRPERPRNGKLKLFFYRKTSRDTTLIGEREFDVIRVPKPKATFLSYFEQDSIPLQSLKYVKKVYAQVYLSQMALLHPCEVVSFQYAFVDANGSASVSGKQEGELLPVELIQSFSNAEKGDVVRISNIRVKLIGTSIRSIPADDFQFTVK